MPENIQKANHQYQDIFHFTFFKDSPISFIIKGLSFAYDSLVDNFVTLLLSLLLLNSGSVRESSLSLNIFYKIFHFGEYFFLFCTDLAIWFYYTFYSFF